MLESVYQSRLIKKLRRLLPGCYVLKNDSSYMQGIPDLLVLYGAQWAMLEVKAEEPTGPDDFEPNQEWYLQDLGQMSFTACVHPRNEGEVLHALCAAFGVRR